MRPNNENTGYGTISGMLETVLQTFETLPVGQGYAYFCGVVLLCCLGAPFSSDLMLVLAAFFAARGYFNIVTVMILGYCTLMTGDSINFLFARRWGRRLILKRPLRWIFNEEKAERIRQYFNSKGAKFLYGLRFMPIGRALSFFTLGMLQIRPRLFYTANLTTTALYIPLIMGTTYYTGKNLDAVIATVKSVQQAVLIVFVIAVTVVIFLRRSNSNNRRSEQTR